MDRKAANPFAFLAAAAFLAGFVGYLTVSLPVIAKAYDEADAPAQVSGPVASEWRHERQI